jgi:hypothetical protein
VTFVAIILGTEIATVPIQKRQILKNMLPVVQEILSSLQEQSAQVLKDSCLLDNQEDPVDSQEMWRMCYMTSTTCLATSWVETSDMVQLAAQDLMIYFLLL